MTLPDTTAKPLADGGLRVDLHHVRRLDVDLAALLAGKSVTLFSNGEES